MSERFIQIAVAPRHPSQRDLEAKDFPHVWGLTNEGNVYRLVDMGRIDQPPCWKLEAESPFPDDRVPHDAGFLEGGGGP